MRGRRDVFLGVALALVTAASPLVYAVAPSRNALEKELTLSVPGKTAKPPPPTTAGGPTMPSASTAAGLPSDAAGIIPSGNWSFHQFDKQAAGTRSLAADAERYSFRNDAGGAWRASTSLLLTLDSIPASDENPVASGLPGRSQNPMWVPNGSSLEATGVTFLRRDDLAFFIGRFSLRAPSGALLFAGTLELFERTDSSASHSASAVRARQEGWLVGTGTGVRSGIRLRAAITADGRRPQLGRSQSLGSVRMTGVLMWPPAPEDPQAD